jgi:hypothetical protein
MIRNTRIGRWTLSGVLTSGLFTMSLLAQGPPPPHHGGGFGGPMDFGGRTMWAGPHMNTPVTGAPYSAVESVSTQQALANGNQIARQQESKVYRDSQGRTRMEHTMPAPPDAASQTPRTDVTIFDPVAGYVYHLNPQKQTYVQMAIRQHPASAASGASGATDSIRAHHGSAGQTETLAAQSINGLSATGTRHTQTIPAGAIGNTDAINIVRESWVSQDLKVPVMIKTSDPRFGATTMQLTNIVRSEPDAALFQIPSGYTLQAAPEGRGPGGHAGGGFHQ